MPEFDELDSEPGVAPDDDGLEPEKPTLEPEEEEIEPEEEQLSDYSEASLTRAQLDNYNRLKADGKTPRIVDGSGGGPRDYKALSKAWFPLILDHPNNEEGPQRPWTLDEILNAMTPVIRMFAREYGGLRTGYQRDEAISDGQMAVLNALQTDGGFSPFALYAAQNVKRAIQKGLKGAGILPATHRERTYTDRDVTSLDKPPSSGEGTATLGGTVGGSAPTTAKVKCPACNGKGVVKGPETGERETCEVCNGKGRIVVPDPRTTKSPAEEAEETEQRKRAIAAVQYIVTAARLSARQTEAYLLHHGVEGAYDPSVTSTTPRMPQAISRILAAADAIYYVPAPELVAQGKAESGIWVEAVDQGRQAEFQEIWDETFGDIAHRPFNPSIPASLQIAPLHDVKPDKPQEDKPSSVWPPSHRPLQDRDRLEELMTNLQAIADIQPASKSKQFAVNQLNIAKRKIEALKQSGNIPPKFDLTKFMESVEIATNYYFEVLMETIDSDQATFEYFDGLL